MRLLTASKMVRRYANASRKTLFHRATNLCDFASSKVRTASITCKTCCRLAPESTRQRSGFDTFFGCDGQNRSTRPFMLISKQPLLWAWGASNPHSPRGHPGTPLFSRQGLISHVLKLKSLTISRKAQVRRFRLHTTAEEEEQSNPVPME